MSAGKTYAVFGLGKSGKAAVSALLASGNRVFAWDDAVSSREGVSCLKNPAEYDWSEIDSLVLSPGIPLTHPAPHPVAAAALAAGKEIICDIELLYRMNPSARFVGITGTNGKSTTTSLTGHVLKQAGLQVEVGGNLGTPALSLGSPGAGGVYVLEMSSYQLDLIKDLRFSAAALLNISPDHIDRHGSMEGYIKAKKRIFMNRQKNDAAVIGVDDEYCRRICEGIEGAVPISGARETSGVYAVGGELFAHGRKICDLRRFERLPGAHNWQNAAAAFAICEKLGVSEEKIIEGFRTFPGLAHRMEKVAEIRGVSFVNDSKATNADSTARALSCYDGAVYWIAGGKPKEGGITSLAPFFPKIAHAFLIGEAEKEFAATIEGKIPCTLSRDLKTAFAQASGKAMAEGKKGAVVLLSPACASFDQWKNFEERGDAFRNLALDLVGKEVSHAAG